ncbi:MAG: SDR family NAD(P)-dependent oxidoreductase [Candidatus Omnitrophica bacterium]|nr:SDR family NAD(P)-dependent oxidoreductase [Candidatus Omnitrophota bacterium]MDD5430514.1 SDR family NAD(P)-dependent oxidoreductase [Candidatus Omnitrophota bacterium]
MINLSGKTALISGGTRGIGKAMVDLFASSGCKVIYTGTKNEEKNLSKDKIFMQLDLAQDKSVKDFFSRLSTLERIDILVNNAGINIIEPISEIENENWQKVLKVNLTGPMLLTREISKKMKRSGGGKILNISSIFGIMSRQKRNSYSASKAGLIGLTKSSALDLAPYNIVVNALCPGFTLTELTTSILSKEEIEALKKEIPLGRFASVEEIARVALFLCSDLNSYMTGQVVIADGGYILR